ncbi:MAG: DUF3302 domain-containing protein [Candidatus Thiodiazotropha sp. (ex Dulcina madagascariensis)]|nr:DUF3302 domain-containing protein [Candidatus Thiodiazotropha sp. (ex Dulcina madagascariensis)]
MFLDYFALFLVLFVVVFFFYAIIVIHDIPYEIAKRRNHPHQDAIHVAGWISLFTLHTIWPFLWIWSTLYREDRGWGFKKDSEPDSKAMADGRINALQEKIDALSSQVKVLKAAFDRQASEKG